MDECINKTGTYIQWNMILPFRGKEILTHGTRWMNLEDIMLSVNRTATKRQILYDSTDMKQVT